MKQFTLPYNLNQTGKKIGSAKIPSHYAEKFQQATLDNYGQAEIPEWDDQASKHQCYKKRKQPSVKKYFLKMKLSGENIQKHS